MRSGSDRSQGDFKCRPCRSRTAAPARKQTMLLTLQNGLGNEEIPGRALRPGTRAGRALFHLFEPRFANGDRALRLRPYCDRRARTQPRRTDPTPSLRNSRRAGSNAASPMTSPSNTGANWFGIFRLMDCRSSPAESTLPPDSERTRPCTARPSRSCTEVIEGANKCGHPLKSGDVLEQIKRTESMGAYKPSTLLDWEAGKPLEIEAIWGEPLRRAAAAGARTPRLEIVHALLKHLDAGSDPSEDALPRVLDGSRGPSPSERNKVEGRQGLSKDTPRSAESRFAICSAPRSDRPPRPEGSSSGKAFANSFPRLPSTVSGPSCADAQRFLVLLVSDRPHVDITSKISQSARPDRRLDVRATEKSFRQRRDRATECPRFR